MKNVLVELTIPCTEGCFVISTRQKKMKCVRLLKIHLIVIW